MSLWVRKRGNCSTPFHRNSNDPDIAGNSLKHISNIKRPFLIPGNLLLQTVALASQLVCSGTTAAHFHVCSRPSLGQHIVHIAHISRNTSGMDTEQKVNHEQQGSCCCELRGHHGLHVCHWCHGISVQLPRLCLGHACCCCWLAGCPHHWPKTKLGASTCPIGS